MNGVLWLYGLVQYQPAMGGAHIASCGDFLHTTP